MTKRIYFDKEEIKITKTKGYFELEEDYTQMYNSLFKLTGKMKSKVDFQLFTFLCSTASPQGMIYITHSFYELFNELNKENGAENITRTTFQNSVKNLTDSKILIKTGKGEYQLNPFYLWKDSIQKRKDITREIQQLPIEEREKFLLDDPFIKYGE